MSALALGIGAVAAALLLSPAVRRTAPIRMLTTAVSSSSPSAGALTGILYRYKADDWPAPLQAFESPMDHSHDKYCIYVGGLTDGLLACKYVDQMAIELDKLGWALVQPILTSSYTGYGCSSLANDAAQLSELLFTIDRREQHGARPVKAFAIVGHSTGCQDAVALLRSAPPAIRAKLRAAVLQAPVSDREADSLENPDPELLKRAEALVAAGKGDTLLTPFLHNGFVPINAARYASLNGRLGADDVFSSDLSDVELVQRLGHMGTKGQREGIRAPPGSSDEWLVEPVPSHPGLRTLFCHSGGDEYVPPSVDVPALSRRFVAAAGGSSNGAEAAILNANHNCAVPESAGGDFIVSVCRILRDVDA